MKARVKAPEREESKVRAREAEVSGTKDRSWEGKERDRKAEVKARGAKKDGKKAVYAEAGKREDKKVKVRAKNRGEESKKAGVKGAKG